MIYKVFVTQVGTTERHNMLEVEAASPEEAQAKAEKRLEEEVITDWEYEEWFDVDDDEHGQEIFVQD